MRENIKKQAKNTTRLKTKKQIRWKGAAIKLAKGLSRLERCQAEETEGSLMMVMMKVSMMIMTMWWGYLWTDTTRLQLCTCRPQRWSIFRAMQCRWFIFQQRCDTDYFWEKLNIAIIAIIFLDHREQLFFDYFAHFRTIILGLFTDWLGSSKRKEGSYTRNQMQRDFLTMYYR